MNWAPESQSSRNYNPPGISIPFSYSGSAESQNAAAENKDREVIIAMVTKAVTAITQRLTSLSTFDGTDSKVGGRFAILVHVLQGGLSGRGQGFVDINTLEQFLIRCQRKIVHKMDQPESLVCSYILYRDGQKDWI